jgi:hypothetical protein
MDKATRLAITKTLSEIAERHAILIAGPDHEHYWDTWDDVLRLASCTNQETGWHYGLEQDGSLYAVYRGQA